jgi:hypothetical protein
MVVYGWAHAHLKEANGGLEWQPPPLPIAEALGHGWLHWLLQLCPRLKKYNNRGKIEAFIITFYH